MVVTLPNFRWGYMISLGSKTCSPSKTKLINCLNLKRSVVYTITEKLNFTINWINWRGSIFTWKLIKLYSKVICGILDIWPNYRIELILTDKSVFRKNGFNRIKILDILEKIRFVHKPYKSRFRVFKTLGIDFYKIKTKVLFSSKNKQIGVCWNLLKIKPSLTRSFIKTKVLKVLK